ncbi:single-stranded DNA-binding protein [Pseudactinotalea sp. Z1748]|uniref:single-stranded DNA-binding protein n=1 Tax=Pseudactinotalea sp. Z1748 TaxID=3413027 RepID=UPI003C7DB541
MVIKAPITVEGNLTGDPDLIYTDDGKPYARFNLAINDRQYNNETGQFEEVGEPIFHGVTVFGQQAENVANSLRKGDTALVQGDLRFTTWQTDDGQRRQGSEILARGVGPSLRFKTAQVDRSPKAPSLAAETTGPTAATAETGPITKPAPVPEAASPSR